MTSHAFRIPAHDASRLDRDDLYAGLLLDVTELIRVVAVAEEAGVDLAAAIPEAMQELERALAHIAPVLRVVGD